MSLVSDITVALHNLYGEIVPNSQTKVTLKRFSPGSIIATYEVYILKNLSVEKQTASELQKSLMAVVQSQNGTPLGFGFSENDVQVNDVNECDYGADKECHASADCTNLDGSFSCKCQEGFYDSTPDGFEGRVCEKNRIRENNEVVVSLVAVVVILVIVIMVGLIYWKATYRPGKIVPKVENDSNDFKKSKRGNDVKYTIPRPSADPV
jgi:cobalamin biosynthesis Mg chelatase CobN